MENGIGLVLAGGGGKGAYQIGIWKAMREMGVDKNITSIAGTSVGALNSVLFTSGNYDAAENIWLNISPEQILTKHSAEKALKKIECAGLQAVMTAIAERLSMMYGLGMSVTVLVAANILEFIKDGAFSRNTLAKIIDEKADLKYVSVSEIKTYAICTKMPKLEERCFLLNGNNPERIKNIILASSAIPLIFSPQKIDGDEYYDGGLCCNNPVEILYKNGYRNIISVPLKLDDSINMTRFKDARIIEIVPKKNLGNALTGTLDFTADGAKSRIEQGYNDAMEILVPMYEYSKCQNDKKKDFIRYKDDLAETEKEHKQSLKHRKKLKEDIYNLL